MVANCLPLCCSTAIARAAGLHLGDHVSKAAGRRLVIALSFVFSQLVLLLILRMPVVPGDGNWLKAFRGYFSYDQLSYAAIASTVASGNNGFVEPFTETGTSFYPSLWYRILGWLAALTGQSVVTMWTLAGWFVLALAVAVIGYVGFRVSSLAWAPALVAPALLVGTLSTVLHDDWMTPLESHATLWGPAASIYPLNAEVIGLACTATALALVLRATVGRPVSHRSRILLLTVAAALLGITANVQTYAFFAGVSIAFAWLGAYGLLRSRSRNLLVVTIVLLALMVAAGRFVGENISALLTYGLLVLVTLPGALWIARSTWRVLVLPGIAFAVTALPQMLLVGSGTLANDPFLAYREDASAALGVPVWAAAFASLPILAVWAFNVAVQRSRRNDAVLAALLGWAFAATLLTFNNVWGFGQEPYRLWIASVTLGALLLSVTTAWSIAQVGLGLPDRGRVLVPVTAGIAIVLFGLSLFDFGGLRGYVADSGVIRFDTARTTAIETVTGPADGLLASDPCIDPAELKVITRNPVAFYNLGIAWPANRSEIDAVQGSRVNNVFDANVLRNAGVQYVVTDTSCPATWPVEGTMGAVKVGSLDYADEMGTGTIAMWRLVS